MGLKRDRGALAGLLLGLLLALHPGRARAQSTVDPDTLEDHALSDFASAPRGGDNALLDRATLDGALRQIESVVHARAVFRADLATRRERLAIDAATWPARDAALTASTARVPSGGPEADALYDAIVAEVQPARESLRDALGALHALPAAPRLPPGFIAHLEPMLSSTEGARLAAVARHFDDRAKRLDDLARAVARERVNVSASHVRRLDALRVAWLDHLSDDKRDAVLGFGREGFAQLLREARQVVLLSQWYAFDAPARVGEIRARLHDPFAVGALLSALLRIALVVGAAWLFAGRIPAGIERLRAAVTRRFRRRPVTRPLLAALGALGALVPTAVPLAVVVAIRGTLRAAEAPELDAAVDVVRAYFAYRLLLAAAQRLFARESRGTSHVRRVLRSLQLVGRYALAVAVTLILSETVLGRGYLFRLVERFAWLGALPILAVLVRRWRGDISDAYLARLPEGALADAVRATRVRWYGFFVAVAAFGAMTALSLARGARRFVFGFEQSRKALAYLFRRRLERQVAENGVAASQPLPESLRALFADHPVDNEPYVIDRFPDMDQFESLLREWRDGARNGSVLVVGETGFGKSSWLRAAVRRTGDLPVATVTLTRRVLSTAELVLALADAVGAPPEVSTLEGLIAHLQHGAQRVVLIDDLHRLVLRGVGTLDAWSALLELIEKTGHRVFWLCAAAHYPYHYVRWVRGEDTAFRLVVRLRGWAEADIQRLLDARTEASGYQVLYDDLVIDRVDGADNAERVIGTRQGYVRMLWDYADGAPRVALHCWAQSLVAEDARRVRVRLFSRPEHDALEKLPETDRFVLATVVWHEQLSVAEVARALRRPAEACGASLARLHEQGVLVDAGGVFRVSTAWLRPAVRFLRRKHLVES